MPWDYTPKNYKKQAKADALWRIERTLNYGTPKIKLRRAEVKKLFSKLKIPEDRRTFLSLILWKKKKF